MNWRLERKILLSPSDLLRATDVLLLNPAGLKKIYYEREVHNCYFDTPDFALYEAHRSGHFRRRKWRLRSYGEEEKWQLEEKIKQGNNGSKRFYDPEAALAAHAKMQAFSVNELLLYPVLENSYQRTYYLSSEGKVRVTLDTNMRYRLSGKVWASDPDVAAILEVKYFTEDWQAGEEFLGGLPWRVSRYSKYMRGIQITEGLTRGR